MTSGDDPKNQTDVSRPGGRHLHSLLPGPSMAVRPFEERSHHNFRTRMKLFWEIKIKVIIAALSNFIITFTFKCNICNHTFTQTNILRTQMITKNWQGSNKCNQCDYKSIKQVQSGSNTSFIMFI